MKPRKKPKVTRIFSYSYIRNAERRRNRDRVSGDTCRRTASSLYEPKSVRRHLRQLVVNAERPHPQHSRRVPSSVGLGWISPGDLDVINFELKCALP